jgi:hypothetical protein
MPLSWDQPSLVGDGSEVASPAPVDLDELLRLDQPPWPTSDDRHGGYFFHFLRLVLQNYFAICFF